MARYFATPALLLNLFLNTSAAFAIINGVPTTEEYAAVGSLRSSADAFCTATLISPEWIVMAQHCRWGGSEEEPVQYEPKDLYFQIGKNSNEPEFSVPLIQWINAPEIEVLGSDEKIHLDIAFGKLSIPLRSVNGKSIEATPINVTEGLITTGKDVEIVGFGLTGEFSSPKGKRLKGTYQVTSLKDNAFLNIFQSLEDFSRYLQAAHPGEEEATERHIHNAQLIEKYQLHAWDPRGRENGIFTTAPTGGWFNTYSGDSGGPLLLRSNNKLEVVGIIQSGFPGTTTGSVPIGSIIGLFGPEIQKVLRDENIPFVSNGSALQNP